jgi:RNA polymerase sigma factor (sigma-70 family)
MAMMDIEQLLTITRRVCADRDWRLLELPELGVNQTAFAKRVADRLQYWQATEEHTEAPAVLAEHAVFHEYSKLLHRAVGMRGTAAQNRALTEVSNYVTPIIHKYLGSDDQAQDCASETLIAIWQKSAQVREPGSFLHWAATVARNITLAATKKTRREQPIGYIFAQDAEEADKIEAWLTTYLRGEQPSPITVVEEEYDLATWWVALIRRCLQRSLARQEVFIGQVLREDTVVEIARRLGIKAGQVYTLKFRAIETLKECEALLQALGWALAAYMQGAVR